jgi:uncharacterized BrkB/YihY/UPF0761 family membrane protein
MKLFAIICLSLILIAIQHFLNWLFRVVNTDDGSIVLFIILAIVLTIVTMYLGFILAHWIVEL